MEKDLAEMLSNGYGEIHENYSGRGMYGKETFAVEFDSEKTFLSSIADIIDDAIADDDNDELEKLPRLLRKLKMDSMGTGIIIY